MCEFREQQRHVKISAYVEAALANLVYKQTETLATDMELFAKHAKRTIIQVEDVKLCARRNPEFVSFPFLINMRTNDFLVSRIETRLEY